MTMNNYWAKQMKYINYCLLAICILSITSCSRRLTDDDIDYSDSRWGTIEGKKYSTFIPEAKIRYRVENVTHKDCGGSSLKQIYNNQALPSRKTITFMAAESDAGKFYRLRVPQNFTWGKCRYSSYAVDIFMEEKSNDPRLVNDPEYAKGRTRRSNIVTGSNAIKTLSFRDADASSNTYLDEQPINFYCHRVRWWAPDKSFGIVNELMCDTVEGKNIALPLVYYSNGFFKKNPIQLNFKVSNQVYCWKHHDDDCLEDEEKILPQIPKNFRQDIKPDWFTPFNEEDNPDAR